MTKTAENIQRLIAKLVFRSETDDTWALFLPIARRSGPVTSKTMAEITRLEFVEQVDFDTFMDHAIAVQDDKVRYAALKKGFITYIGQRKVFKMLNSPNNFEYYVCGLDRDNNLTGCFVRSVET